MLKKKLAKRFGKAPMDNLDVNVSLILIDYGLDCLEKFGKKIYYIHQINCLWGKTIKLDNHEVLKQNIAMPYVLTT